MAKEFRLPELGENVTSGTIAKVLVAVGDQITAGQNVLEIETDKAVAEIPCPLAGKVTEIRVSEGAKVNSGDVILLVEEADASQDAPAPAKQEQQASVPEKDERDKAKPAPAPQARPQHVAAPRKPGATHRAAPSVRQLARDHDVDINDVPTADPSGKITAQDVLAFVESRTAADAAPATADSAASAANQGPWHNGEGTSVAKDKWGVVVQESMNNIRSRGAERLTASWQQIPHVTHFDKADITAVESLRKQYARTFEDKDARLTVMAFVVKVLSEALARFPRFNASVDMENQQLLLKRYYHIGIAVDTPNGLVVPVLRDTDKKSILEISLEMAELARKARNRKLTIEEMQGGTFTVSNLGGLGGYGFTPIINAPEAAILGLSRSQMEPVYRDGQFEPRLMLPMSLSYDHRIIDGADAARFLRFVAEALEQPWRLFLGL